MWCPSSCLGSHDRVELPFKVRGVSATPFPSLPPSLPPVPPLGSKIPLSPLLHMFLIPLSTTGLPLAWRRERSQREVERENHLESTHTSADSQFSEFVWKWRNVTETCVYVCVCVSIYVYVCLCVYMCVYTQLSVTCLHFHVSIHNIVSVMQHSQMQIQKSIHVHVPSFSAAFPICFCGNRSGKCMPLVGL